MPKLEDSWICWYEGRIGFAIVPKKHIQEYADEWESEELSNIQLRAVLAHIRKANEKD